MVSQSRAAIRPAMAALRWVFRLSQTTTSGPAELLVRGIQERGIVPFGEALALLPAAGTVDAVDQPTAVAGLDGDQRRQ